MGTAKIVDAVAGDCRELGELGARVHAEALAVVVAVEGANGLAVGLEDLEHVGQVVLALGVVASDLADVGGEQRAVEGVAAGIALEERRRLLGRAVLLLDVALDGAVLCEHDAAVAERIGRGDREGRGGRLAVRDGLGEGADGLGGDERQVAVEHHDGAGVDAGGLQGDLDGMAGAEALGLLHALDAGVRVCVGGLGDGADLVCVAAHDDDDAVAAAGDGGVCDPADHGLAEDLVGDLGVVRLHAGALAGGEDDGGGVCHGVPSV